jgi:hypothetical protein
MDSLLVTRAKQLLRDGRLPFLDRFKSFGGPSRGSTCALCESAISAGEMEMEIEWTTERGTERLVLHPRCQGAWSVALQTEKNDRSDRSEPA